MPADESGSSPAGDGPLQPPPHEPALEDCCNGACERRVFDVYQEVLERYREALRVWRLQHPAAVRWTVDPDPDPEP